MFPRTLAVTALLLAAPVALLPAASADTCASVVFEPLVCTPVNAFYCALYGSNVHEGIKEVEPLGVPLCLVRVVAYCLQACPGSSGGIIELGPIDASLP